MPNETMSHRAKLNIIRLTDTPGYNKLIPLVVDRIRVAVVELE